MPEAPAGYDWGTPGGEGGMIMIGEKGGICHNGMRPDSPRLYPKQKWEDYRASGDKQVAKTLPRTQGIYRDWIEAITQRHQGVLGLQLRRPANGSHPARLAGHPHRQVPQVERRQPWKSPAIPKPPP